MRNKVLTALFEQKLSVISRIQLTILPYLEYLDYNLLKKKLTNKLRTNIIRIILDVAISPSRLLTTCTTCIHTKAPYVPRPRLTAQRGKLVSRHLVLFSGYRA